MVLHACGLNYKTAPVDLREQFAFTAESSEGVLQTLLDQPAVSGAVLLSTCNRTEVYVDALEPIDISTWLAQQGEMSVESLQPHLYTLHGSEMVRHLMRVASGIDSMVVGEPQILGQMKAAFAMADSAGYASGHLKHLFPAVFSACKHIRHATNLGKCPVSVAYIVVKLIKQLFADLSQCRVLLVGSGDIMELVATHLKGQSVSHIAVASRRVETAQPLAESLHGHAITIGDVPAYMAQADIVVCATASQLPIIGKGMIERIMAKRDNQPLFIADLAVPRDVEPEVATLSGVSLYNIDDLQQVAQQGIATRQDAILQAEKMIELHAANYQRNANVINSAQMISSYRKRIDDVRDHELQKAMKMLESGHSPKVVLGEFAHAFTNKVLHQPTKKLREFASLEMAGTLSLVKEFFEL